LFNLSRSRQFLGNGGIYCNSGYGPVFIEEAGSADLGAFQPFNGDNKCLSFANRPGYRIGVVDGVNMLTNQKDGAFTISELEVWQVTFIVINYINLLLYRTNEI
jgi:hypothetical protein